MCDERHQHMCSALLGCMTESVAFHPYCGGFNAYSDRYDALRVETMPVEATNREHAVQAIRAQQPFRDVHEAKLFWLGSWGTWRMPGTHESDQHHHRCRHMDRLVQGPPCQGTQSRYHGDNAKSLMLRMVMCCSPRMKERL